MSSAGVAAGAAVIAALVSIANIIISTRAKSDEEVKRWAREMLPDTAMELSKVYAEHMRALLDADWQALEPDVREMVGMAQFSKANRIIERMSLFASPETIMKAYDVLYVLDEWRLVANGEEKPPSRFKWTYNGRASEATRAFTQAVRKELGLRPLADTYGSPD